MHLVPLYPRAALLLAGAESRSLVVSDLHLGIESALSLKGIDMPETHLATEMLGQLRLICRENLVTQIVIAGDLKHAFGSITKQEWNEIPKFLADLNEVGQVFLVPGNHDSAIRHLVPLQVNLASPSGLTLEDTLVLHGHSLPSEIPASTSRLVMGHLHPALHKKGHVLDGQPVWVYLQVDRTVLTKTPGSDVLDVVIIPSFNRYLYAATGVSALGRGNRTTNRKRLRTTAGDASTNAGYRSSSISPVTYRIISHQEAIRRCIITTLDGAIVGGASMLDDIF